ncbi:MAG: DUF1778 domain-containing protein [Spirochaetaceae bacterium]|nr:DUF1778 domain-containing protein [Spirochaetaceae bacterium]
MQSEPRAYWQGVYTYGIQSQPMAQVNFGMKNDRLALIDRAAAIEVLSERPVIALGDEAYAAFVAALDAPVEPNNRLQELFGRRAQWER